MRAYLFANLCQPANGYNKRFQVAYTHAHAYMWPPVPQGGLRLFSVLYIPDVTITYVTRIVAECVVTIQSRCLEPEF